MFATHYHELTVLEEQIRGLKNLNVDVAEEDGNIIFLHEIVEGSASRSYRIHVAKLACIPESLLARAREKLADLEKDQLTAPSQSHADKAADDDQGSDLTIRTNSNKRDY